MPPFIFMLLSLAFWVAVIGGGFMLAFRIVRALENRGTDRQDVERLREKVGQLEESLEGMSGQLERLAEAQQFTTRLLTEKNDTVSRE
jgi:hypothetical protein